MALLALPCALTTSLLCSVTAFFSSASLSGAFSGILAYAIIRMDGVAGRPGWAWIFILEGLFTVVFGLCSYFILPCSPSQAGFLNEEEKSHVISELETDGTRNNDADSFSWKEVVAAFTRPQVGILAIVFFMSGAFCDVIAYYVPSHSSRRHGGVQFGIVRSSCHTPVYMF